MDNVSVGQLRMKYLDTATMSLINNDFESTSLYVDSFLIWITEGTESEKDITQRFKIINEKADARIQAKRKELEEERIQKIEADELLENEAAKASAEAIKEMLNACLQVSLKNGLFNE